MPKGYRDPQIRKQISIYLPNADWQALSHEAVRRQVPLAELCRRWLRPRLERLRQTPPPEAASDPRRPGL
jgi:hypothetical protein